MLEIELCEVKGVCPVHKVGDRIVVEGVKVLLEETDALCVRALSVLLYCAVALDEGSILAVDRWEYVRQ